MAEARIPPVRLVLKPRTPDAYAGPVTYARHTAVSVSTFRQGDDSEARVTQFAPEVAITMQTQPARFRATGVIVCTWRPIGGTRHGRSYAY